MNDVGLDRVRQDLETMKQAAAVELPFGREDLKWGWIDGLIFVPLAAWAWLGPGTYMSLAIILSLLATLPGAWAVSRKYRREQDRHPSRWREQRRGTLLLLAVVPPGYLLFVWAVVNGTPPNTMVGLTLAVGGGVATFIGLLSRIRRYWLGMGIAMIACGLVMPGASDRQVGLAMALMFIVGAPVSTVIAAWQLRAQESGHATN
jgi:MFS family permease